MRALTIVISFGILVDAGAFPPAPHHELYGSVRDERGTPLSGDATVRLIGPSGPVLAGVVDRSIGVGINYSLKVPMDTGWPRTS